MAAVAGAVDGDDETVVDYLERVDRADTLWELNRDGEHALAGGRYGEDGGGARSEEHTSELQSLMRISYAVFCLKKKIIILTVHYRDTSRITSIHLHRYNHIKELICR